MVLGLSWAKVRANYLMMGLAALTAAAQGCRIDDVWPGHAVNVPAEKQDIADSPSAPHAAMLAENSPEPVAALGAEAPPVPCAAPFAEPRPAPEAAQGLVVDPVNPFAPTPLPTEAWQPYRAPRLSRGSFLDPSGAQPVLTGAERRELHTPLWLAQAALQPVGHTFLDPDQTQDSQATLYALGYRPYSGATWLREADLLEAQPLTPSAMAELPEIDTIAVISTYRPYLTEQYLYKTLMALFRALPSTAVINVLVGNRDTAYVAPQMLRDVLGGAWAERVHVVPTPEATGAFFERNAIYVGARATWNYARALRNYTGSHHLLLVEDDIDIVPDALRELRPHLVHPMTGVFVLYNDRCWRNTPAWEAQDSAWIINAAPITRSSDFPTTQAIVYSSDVAADLGDYLTVRAGRESYDYLVGRFLGPYNYLIGYVYPSLVQHTGFITTGLSAPGSLPRTGCYAPIALPWRYPQPE